MGLGDTPGHCSVDAINAALRRRAVRHRPALIADGTSSTMTSPRRDESATNVSLIGAGWVARAGYATVRLMKPTAINFH